MNKPLNKECVLFGCEGRVLLKLPVCKVTKTKPSVLGQVAASFRLSFSHIFPLRGARRTARAFCCPAWFFLLLNLGMVDRVSRLASGVGSVHWSWGGRVAGGSLHTGACKTGSNLCAVGDGCSLGSFSEPHAFTQLVPATPKCNFSITFCFG